MFPTSLSTAAVEPRVVKVLLVEDDQRISAFVARGLRAEGYRTLLAADGQQALAALDEQGDDLDLVLLDLGLPDIDGKDLLQALRRRWPGIPVIALTARDDIREKVSVLDAGASDYVTKPFAFDELLARIRAALRSRDQQAANQLAVADLVLDLSTKVAWRSGQRIELAPREWALLELFMRHPDRVLSRVQILSHVWDYSFEPGSNVVDVYVGYLRRKIDLPGLPTLIQTVRGAGYRMSVAADI